MYKNIGIACACIIVILVIVCNCQAKPSACTYDGRCYEVANRDDKEKAAKLLADINRFILTYMRALRRKYIWGDERNLGSDIANKPAIQRLFHNYSPDIIGENDPTSTKNTSYVLNKNDAMKFCLREKVTGRHEFIALEDLKFVVLHELAHMADENYGHTISYWKVFKVILREAVLAGVYTPRDYSQHPFNYCGLTVASNPLFDASL